MGNRFSSAKHSIAECDRCGFRYKLKVLKRLVIKTKQIDMLVCPQCWEPDQPQLLLGMYPVDDPQGVRNPRPDRSYVASGTLADGYLGEGSRVIQWGWRPVGGGYSPIDGGTPNYLVAQTFVGTVTVEIATGPVPSVYAGNVVELAATIDTVAATHLRPTTLDPAYTSGGGLLSNGDLTYTWNTIGNSGCSFSTISQSTGKYYFEVVNTVAGGYGGAIYDNWAFSGGVCIAASRNTANFGYIGDSATSWGFSNANSFGDSAHTQTRNAGGAGNTDINVPQIPQGGYLAVAVDFDAGKIWFNANGSWILSGNPATGANPVFTFTPNTPLYAGVGQSSRSPFGESTVNFGATTFAGTVPTGFVSWNTVG